MVSRFAPPSSSRFWRRLALPVLTASALVLATAAPSNAAVWYNSSGCYGTDAHLKASTELKAWDTGSTVRIGVGTKGHVYKTNCAGTGSRYGSLAMTWSLTVYGRSISCAVGVPPSASCGGSSSERTMTVNLSKYATSLSSVVATDSMYFKDSGDATKICSTVNGYDGERLRVITTGCLAL